MAEKLKWRPRRKKIIAQANKLEPRYRKDFLETVRIYGMDSDVENEEHGVTVARGQEWRLEKLLRKDFSKNGKGKVYTRRNRRGSS